jgi:glycosyltransferase involved in cell wall biosynthesis
MKAHYPSIAYLSQVFPSLSTTFTYREVLGLRKIGWEIVNFSIWKPSLDELSAEAKDLVRETFYAFPINIRAFLEAHFYYVLQHPIKYLSTLASVNRQPQGGIKKRFRALAHFAEGVYLARQMEKRGIRHVHVTFAHTASVALVISQMTDISFSFTAHAVDIYANNPPLLPLKLNVAKFVITVSEYNRKNLTEIADNSDAKRGIYIVHYGVDLKSFFPIEKKEKRKTPIILSIGRLVEKKGFSYLIKACEILVEKGYKFHCQIVGDGPLRDFLQTLIDQKNLGDHVKLVGVVFQENIRNYLNQAEIFALPCVIAANGDRDGVPNVLIEAMAMKLPVISTNIIGIPELIRDGRDGLLVPQKDEVALADTIEFLLKNEDLRHLYGKEGRARIEEDFNLTKTSAQLDEIFRKELIY